MGARYCLLALILGMSARTIAAQDVLYVSPVGQPMGDGSVGRPLDLATAIGPNSRARPGDTILMRGGLYPGRFTSSLTGSVGSPIVVRAFAGERVTIDGSLTVRGAWAWYWGLEITNSNPDRASVRPQGIEVFGPNTKLINLVVHDTGTAIGCWTPAVDAEIYGCIIYRNGWQGPHPDRGHGHGVYMQNDAGTKRVVDNIIFNQYGYGIHAYGEAGALKGFHIEGNSLMNSGSPTRNSTHYDNILVGGEQPAERVTILRNLSYHSPGRGGANVLGWGKADNKDVLVEDNFFVGGNPTLMMRGWQQATIRNNTFYEKLYHMLKIELPRSTSQFTNEVDGNTYWQGENLAPFGYGLQIYNFANWQRNFGYDRNGRWLPSASKKPSGIHVFVRPNLYEPGRAHVSVLNWDLKETVDVDLRSALSAGTSYEIRNVLDLYGPPVAAGVYTGAPVTLSMTGTETGPEFNVFLVTPGPRVLPPRLRRSPAAR